MDEIINVQLDDCLCQAFESEADPNGSYTGTCTDNIYDTPVQDADDL